MTPAAEVAVDVLVLLRRGRVAPALAQLERLPALIRDDLLEAGAAGYEAGVTEGRRSLAAEITGDAKPKRPAKVAGRERGFGIAGPPDVGSSPPVAQRKRPRHLAWLARRVRDSGCGGSCSTCSGSATPAWTACWPGRCSFRPRNGGGSARGWANEPRRPPPPRAGRRPRRRDGPGRGQTVAVGNSFVRPRRRAPS